MSGLRVGPYFDLTRTRESSVKFSFSSEQEEFRSNLRRLLADRSPTKEARRLMETDDGYERDGWRAINTALGLTAIRIPEAYGGYGLGFGDQCIVLEEMGRAIVCAPYFATAVLAACGGGGSSGSGAEAPQSNALDDVEGVTDVTFWHSMDGSNGEALQGLVDEFNAANEGEIAVSIATSG